MEIHLDRKLVDKHRQDTKSRRVPLSDPENGVEMANIKVRENGPLLVEGDDVTLVDWNGNPYEVAKRPFALCRCGASKSKPFCDGSHRTIDFQGSEAGVPGGAPKPTA
jgi:CDGSH-type Zn-finger protein